MSASASARETTLTRTVELVPTATSYATGLPSGTGNQTGQQGNATLSTVAPSPTQSSSMGGKTAPIGTNAWMLGAGAGVAACFFLFA